MQKAPGKAFREGVSLIELMDLFPDEEAATKWFEQVVWGEDRHCPRCLCSDTTEVPNAKPMPYWCTKCRKYFSVRTGTAIERSKVPLRKWAIAIYLCLTSLKSVSSMKLHRDLGVSQPTAWFMLHRLREAWAINRTSPFTGPVEVDETYFGGKRHNMSKSRRKELENAGRGPAGKIAVVGAKDRRTNKVSAQVVTSTDKPTLQGFVKDNAAPDAKVYTDEANAYIGLPFDHETVRHSVAEYVRDQAHTNGVESFWATLKRAQEGTFHKISPKHLNRYVKEFEGKHNMRTLDTITQMALMAAQLVGRRLMYSQLIKDNGLSAGARS